MPPLKPVTAAELGASLRRATSASLSLGRSNSWTPAPPFRGAWERAAAGDQLALTVTEADAHAALLVQSSLEHAEGVAHFVTRRAPFLPHSIGRTAIEHGLRAMHYLDDQADERERSARRLNEWLYALEESARQRKGIVDAGHPGADTLQGEDPMLERIIARADALQLPLHKGKQPWHVGSTARWSTMKLAEYYLGGSGGEGVAAMVMRSHAAMDHGVETALLGTVEDQVGPHGVNVFRPSAMPVPRLAFSLMGVPLASISAIRTLHHHYGWPPEHKSATVAAAEHNRTLDLWQRAIGEYLDDHAPERPRTGVFNSREFGTPRNWVTPST